MRDTPTVEVVVGIVVRDAVCDPPGEVVVLLVANLVIRPSVRESEEVPRLSWFLWELEVDVARGSGLSLSLLDLRKGLLLIFLFGVRGSVNPEMCIFRRADSEFGSRLNFFFKILCILGAMIKLTLVVATSVMISETPRKNASVDAPTRIIAIGSPMTML